VLLAEVSGSGKPPPGRSEATLSRSAPVAGPVAAPDCVAESREIVLGRASQSLSQLNSWYCVPLVTRLLGMVCVCLCRWSGGEEASGDNSVGLAYRGEVYLQIRWISPAIPAMVGSG